MTGAIHRGLARPALTRDPLRDAYLLAGVVFVAFILAAAPPWLGADAHNYYVARLPNPYPATYGLANVFVLSPVIAQLIAPLQLLPWPVFLALVTAGNLVALWLLVGRWAPLVLLFPPVAIEMLFQNIHLWLAVVLVYGIRYPALWAFPLLTKIAPGIGVLWHLFRGEWRALTIAGGATLALVAVSALVDPVAWGNWLSFLRANVGLPAPVDSVAVPFLPRLVGAIGVMAFAVRTNRAWLIPVAAILATPVIWPATFVLLLAVPKLRPSAVQAEVAQISVRRPLVAVGPGHPEPGGGWDGVERRVPVLAGGDERAATSDR